MQAVELPAAPALASQGVSAASGSTEADIQEKQTAPPWKESGADHGSAKGTPKEEPTEEKTPLFASPQELQQQRNACGDFTLSTTRVMTPYTRAVTVLKGATKAKVNCILAVQPSTEWVVVTILGGNTLEVRVAQNDSAHPRTAKIRIATPQASMLVEVEQAGNPSEFLPL
jgi:hypothetical protein